MTCKRFPFLPLVLVFLGVGTPVRSVDKVGGACSAKADICPDPVDPIVGLTPLKGYSNVIFSDDQQYLLATSDAGEACILNLQGGLVKKLSSGSVKGCGSSFILSGWVRGGPLCGTLKTTGHCCQGVLWKDLNSCPLILADKTTDKLGAQTPCDTSLTAMAPNSTIQKLTLVGCANTKGFLYKGSVDGKGTRIFLASPDCADKVVPTHISYDGQMIVGTCNGTGVYWINEGATMGVLADGTTIPEGMSCFGHRVVGETVKNDARLSELTAVGTQLTYKNKGLISAAPLKTSSALGISPNGRFIVGTCKQKSASLRGYVYTDASGVVPVGQWLRQGGVKISKKQKVSSLYAITDDGTVALGFQKKTPCIAVIASQDLAVLTGPVGDRGKTGDKGAMGARGPKGPKGPAGAQGQQGQQGERGAPGQEGERGQKGPKGPQGDGGPCGKTGDKGPRGITGPKGEKGHTGASPAGPAGKQGKTGPNGQKGPQGARGKVGPQGPAGPTGDRGATGKKGPNGPRGAAGLRGKAGGVGPKGPGGFQGAVGPIGEKGRRGSAGIAGLVGLAGKEVGPKGPKGEKGVPGPQGDPGPQGHPSGATRGGAVFSSEYQPS